MIHGPVKMVKGWQKKEEVGNHSMKPLYIKYHAQCCSDILGTNLQRGLFFKKELSYYTPLLKWDPTPLQFL